MRCRRCDSIRLIKLEKKREEDNDVFRCGECGYIFSPFYAEYRSVPRDLTPSTSHPKRTVKKDE